MPLFGTQDLESISDQGGKRGDDLVGDTKGDILKVRIFALAKELDYDSKELIKHCNDAGIPVKNSALASISPEERDVVLAYLKTLKSPKTAPAAASPVSAPLRESVPSPDRNLRPIRASGPLARNLRAIGKGRPEQDDAPPEAAEVAMASPPEPVETVAVAPVAAALPAELDAKPDVEPVAPEQPAASSPPVAEAPVEATAEPQPTTEPVPRDDTGTAAVEAPAATPTGPGPLQRSDYMPASGASRIREMRPRPSIQQAPGKGPKPKPKTPARPTLAAPPQLASPSFKPAARKDEAPAQKPEIRLTADFFEGRSPLADHIRRHTDAKDKDKDVKDPVKGRAKTPMIREEETEERRPTRGGGGRLLGLADGRDQRRAARKKVGGAEEESDATRLRRRQRSRRGSSVEYKASASVTFPITIRSLSEAMGRPAADLIRVLFKQGIMANINQNVDEETAIELAMELGVELDVDRPEDFEDVLAERSKAEIEDTLLEPRPPIITILGHVDHGKTTLVDTLRRSNVVKGEAGGITQHIAAYQVERNGRKLTFVDTPGHAAFGEMRARGANVTDIVVLVVAADDGVMPQTIECISHAKAAGVPMVVALNKIDLPDINETRILQELAAQNVIVTDWGGEVELVRISALKGTGVDDLLETLLLTADINEFKGAPSLPAEGICLEGFRDEGRGPMAWQIIRQGTLRVGDVVLCGSSYGRVRSIYNDRDEELQEAGPSTPVKISGLDTVPEAGSQFYVMDDIEAARAGAEQRRDQGRSRSLTGRGGPRTLEEILRSTGKGAVKELPLILKCDTPGSIEALRGEILKFEHPEVRVKILHEGVGGVNESDVYLASASGAIVVAFHVVADDRALQVADREGVQVRRYSIIYEVTDDIKRSLEGLLTPDRVEVGTGRVIVLRVFDIARFGRIAGCRVLNGAVDRNNRVRVIRDQTVIGSYSIASLKREKDDAKEVREGFECGIRLDGFNDVKEGDLLESFRVEEQQRKLEG